MGLRTNRKTKNHILGGNIMAAKKMEEKKSDDLIIGKKMIEEFLKKDIDFALTWMRAFEFPLKKRSGFPSISKKEFHTWAETWEIANIPPHKISTEMLERIARKKRIAAMENEKLVGINEIAAVVHRPTYDVSPFLKNYDDCPIKKIGGILQVGKRDLIEWLEENKIPWGHYMGESTR